jgi:hypothetical protein
MLAGVLGVCWCTIVSAICDALVIFAIVLRVDANAAFDLRNLQLTP